LPDQETGSTACWELRQKHASFFQTMLGSIQQSALASNTASAILLSLAGILTKLSGVAPSQDWKILFVAVIAWVVLSATMVTSFSRSALHIEETYLREHADLFPGAPPYKLESFLLDFANRSPWLVGKRAEPPPLPPAGI